jgi:hypothetical protein
MQFGGSGAASGRQGQWLLPHDNAPSHTLLAVEQSLATNRRTLHLTRSDSSLFHTPNMCLKGTHFTTMEDIKSNAMAELQRIPKEAFWQCFQQWQDQWSKCVCVHMIPTLKVIR